MEKKFRRIDLKNASEGTSLIENAMYVKKETKTHVNKATGKSFPSTDLIFKSEDGTQLYLKSYADLNQSFRDQEIQEGDIVSINFLGREKTTTKFGKEVDKYSFDVRVIA